MKVPSSLLFERDAGVLARKLAPGRRVRHDRTKSCDDQNFDVSKRFHKHLILNWSQTLPVSRYRLIRCILRSPFRCHTKHWATLYVWPIRLFGSFGRGPFLCTVALNIPSAEV